jgi:serine/threonine protein phosphatase PrpC
LADEARKVAAPSHRPLPVGPGLRPDSLSGHLPSWVRSRSGTAVSGKTTQQIRIAHAAFYRLSYGMIIGGLFDGVTVPKRSNRAGHVVSAFVRERLRANLAEVDGVKPTVETVLADTLEESIATVLEPLGGGAATTATVIAAAPLSTREWQIFVINAGNSRATVFAPDGTITPITRLKPPGTPFTAVNTLTSGYRYKVEASKLTIPAGAILLLTSDGVHDHVSDTAIWFTLGRAVEAALRVPGRGQTEGIVERLVRSFAEDIVEYGTRVQAQTQKTDDATALALLLGDPTAALDQKRLIG